MLSKSTIVAILLCCFSLINAFGQQSLPLSFSQKKAGFDEIPVKILAPIPQKLISRQKTQRPIASFLKMKEFGTAIKTNIIIGDEGRADTIGNNIIRRIMVKSTGAKSLGLKLTVEGIYSFDSRKIFIYTPDRQLVFSTLSRINDGSSIVLPTIPGDGAIVEVVDSTGSNARFTISEVVHGDFNPLKVYDIGKDISQSCNVDIACPQGADWQLEKNGVVKIEIRDANSTFLCTGVLINNTANNRKPYVLTANHCIGTAARAQNSIFYFGYEKKECGKEAIVQGQSISGSTLRATGFNSRLDFSLVELSQAPPQSFKPYFAGWDIRKNPFTSPGATCLHHPNGDVKKISISNLSPIVGDYKAELDPYAPFDSKSHWRITKWNVGSTESGSSGSPLFNSNHLVTGDLSGGSASCDNPADDYFSAINRAWSDYSDPSYQLKAWLDPVNKGDSTCAGLNSSDLPYNIYVSNPFPCSGDPVTLRSIPEEPNLRITNLMADNGINEISGSGIQNLSWTLKNGEAAKDIYADLVLNGKTLGTIYLLSVKPFPTVPSIFKKGFALSTTSNDLNQWYLNGSLLNNTSTQTIQLQGAGSYTMKAFSSFGCASTSNTIVINYSDFFQPQDVVAYPVPVQNGLVYIKFQSPDGNQPSFNIFGGDIIVNLYDIMGKKLRAELFKGPVELIEFNLPNVTAGVYILEIVGGSKRVAKKIVVTTP